MDQWRSPLRYPGGKIKLALLIREILQNHPRIQNYVEPFAGGGGIAVSLLLNKEVQHITLNDFDPAIYSFWVSITEYNSEFLERLDHVSVNIDEWSRQKRIFSDLDAKSPSSPDETLDLGFATFFLNRTNFSGILRGATPVGGMQQTGKWKIGYEFNKERLRPLISKIGEFADCITVSNLNMVHNFPSSLYQSVEYSPEETLLFIDPPYVRQGKRLYLPIDSMSGHQKISEHIRQLPPNCQWLLTYDNIPKLISFYSFCKNKYLYSLRYKVKAHRVATEFIASSDGLDLAPLKHIQITSML